MKNAIWDHARVGGLKRYNFPAWHFVFVVLVSRSQISPQLTNDPSYWGPDEFYRLGLLETIFMEHNSGSHLPPHRDLLPTPMHSKYLQWCLEHSKYSIKYWLARWSWGLRLKRVLLCSRLGIWSCGQSHPTLLGGTEEGGDQGDVERDLESENLGWISH